MPHVRVAVDRDGTVDDSKNFDEEWVIELAVPLHDAGIAGSSPVPFTASRCDVTKDGVERCGAWTAWVRL